MHENSGPSLIEIIIGGILSLALGAVLACTYLALKPVEIVREMPKKPDPALRYFVDIPREFSINESWIPKRAAFLRGETVEIDAAGANSWLESFFKPDAPGKALPGKQEDIGFDRGVPRIRISKDKPSIEAASIIHANVYGFDLKVLVHTEGKFETINGSLQYRPTSFYVGQLPVHRFPVLMPYFSKQVRQIYPLPSEDAGALEKVASIKIENQQIVLSPAS